MAESRLAPSLQPKNPQEMWKKCVERLVKWKTQESLKFCDSMEYFKKQRALNMVWWEKKMKDDLPSGISEKDTFKILENIYDDIDLSGIESHTTEKSNAETDRKSAQQLIQHMRAFKLLCEGALKQPLTEAESTPCSNGWTDN